MSQADKFHKTGKQLRSKMWWQNMRLKIVVVVVVSDCVPVSWSPLNATARLGPKQGADHYAALPQLQVLVLLLVIFLSIYCNVKHC